MKIKCQVCGITGYLQHIGQNYFRVRHYARARKVGEKVVESNIGLIDCHHLQRIGPKQEWDAFYDKNSGILVTFEETYLPEDYRVTYSYHITDTNANLNVVGSWEMPYYVGTLIVVVIVVSVGVTVFSLRKNVSSSKTQSDQLNNSQSKIHGRRAQKLHRSSLTC